MARALARTMLARADALRVVANVGLAVPVVVVGAVDATLGAAAHAAQLGCSCLAHPAVVVVEEHVHY